MIVDRHRAHDILAGTITQARLPYKPATRTYSQHLPRTGSHMPIRRDTAFGDVAGHVLITGCHKGDHHGNTLTPDHLIALGYDGDQAADAYKLNWLLERDTAWLARRAPGTPDQYPTTLAAAQAAIAQDHFTTPISELSDRFDRAWAPRPVWIVTFEPALDRDMYLAGPPRVRYTTTHDGRHQVDDGIPNRDRGYCGDSIHVPDATDLEDRGYTTGDKDALYAAGAVLDLNVLTLSWTIDARTRHTRARHHLNKPPGNRHAA